MKPRIVWVTGTKENVRRLAELFMAHGLCRYPHRPNLPERIEHSVHFNAKRYVFVTDRWAWTAHWQRDHRCVLYVGGRPPEGTYRTVQLTTFVDRRSTKVIDELLTFFRIER